VWSDAIGNDHAIRGDPVELPIHIISRYAYRARQLHVRGLPGFGVAHVNEEQRLATGETLFFRQVAGIKDVTPVVVLVARGPYAQFSPFRVH